MLRHHSRPGALEPLARHHAVLKAEQGDQRDVDKDRCRERSIQSAIDGLGRDRQVPDEGDQIEEGREEDRIGDQREKK